jgi:hypothetical protein
MAFQSCTQSRKGYTESVEGGTHLAKKWRQFQKENELIETRVCKRIPERLKLNYNPLHLQVEPTVASMSTTNEPTKRMSTRGGARDKMAKVMEHLRSGGIIEEEPSASGGHTAVALANDKVEKAEDTQPSTQTQKKANATRAAKRAPRKKASKAKSLEATKKSGTTNKVNAATKRAVASKLAELEDKFLKKTEAARSSHPRHWTGEVPGKYTLSIDSLTDKLTSG